MACSLHSDLYPVLVVLIFLTRALLSACGRFGGREGEDLSIDIVHLWRGIHNYGFVFAGGARSSNISCHTLIYPSYVIYSVSMQVFSRVSDSRHLNKHCGAFGPW